MVPIRATAAGTLPSFTQRCMALAASAISRVVRGFLSRTADAVRVRDSVSVRFGGVDTLGVTDGIDGFPGRGRRDCRRVPSLPWRVTRAHLGKQLHDELHRGECVLELADAAGRGVGDVDAARASLAVETTRSNSSSRLPRSWRSACRTISPRMVPRVSQRLTMPTG